MGVAGVLAAWFSRSDAMLVDGLYSAVNFFSAVVAAKVSLRVGLPPNKQRPWGYGFEETIYVTFRSLILIGILLFAFFVSGTKVLTFATGGEVPELVFGPIAIYAVAMVLLCGGLAYSFNHAYVKSGRSSALLKTESRAAIVDGAISAGSGIALLSLPFLAGTPLEPIVPVGDAIVVVVLVSIIIWQPFSMFRSAIGELAGDSAPNKTVHQVMQVAETQADTSGYSVLRVVAQRAGRAHIVVVYLNTNHAVFPRQIDEYRNKLSRILEDKIGPVQLEIVLTENTVI
ncbi:cation transporter [Labrenzia sp. PHM005]|nr:cation transporter [Labrenzia sp. PHM005]